MKKLYVFLLYIGIQLVIDSKVYSQSATTNPECETRYSEAEELFNLKQTEAAAKYWNDINKKCPTLSKNLYLLGAKIYRKLVIDEKDIRKKEMYIDSLMKRS
ncbi:MAG: hypothetical protein SNJ71_06675, partial [Bacteroidales bacterium]